LDVILAVETGQLFHGYHLRLDLPADQGARKTGVSLIQLFEGFAPIDDYV
jgi:hypothetical protein